MCLVQFLGTKREKEFLDFPLPFFLETSKVPKVEAKGSLLF
jgi:hypothetical protein